jgi:hypothetical protein
MAGPGFSYQPLDGNEGIRLLHLYPASSPTAEIRCDLIHTTLKMCADIYDHYTALSYVWGNPNDTRTILINGTHVSITINLYSALRDLRHECKAMRVWADAICINQHDHEEKLTQIAKTGRIYSIAAFTVIYLGSLGTDDEVKWGEWTSTDLDEIKISYDFANAVLSQSWFDGSGSSKSLSFLKIPGFRLDGIAFSGTTFIMFWLCIWSQIT